MLCDTFENFRDMRLEIDGLDPALFLSTSGLAWQAALKKTKISLQLLELLTIIDMLLMVENGTRDGISHAIYQHAEANSKYMND